MMPDEASARERWIRELQDIRAELSHLAEAGDDAASIPIVLSSLCQRIDRLMGELREKDDSDSSKELPMGKVVLVVDDNDELRQFVKRALELSDFFVLDAPDGRQALALLEKATALELVLCDVILPGTKGPELMNQIRGLFPNVKTVFMSGYLSDDLINQDVEKILADGGSFLQKPFTTRKMLEVVHGILDV